MAVQTGVGISKILILAGAGYTGTVILRNGKLSDVLSELQQLLKGLDKSEDSSSTDSDALAAHVRRLAMEVRKLASERSIIINGNSSQMGNLTSLAMPAVVLGALGYGYMWWKGFSFSDLMYVTKQNMQTAVQSMTKHLEQVSAALASTKKHLTQRIENLDGKLDEQKEISKLIKNEVIDVRTDLSQIGYDLDALQKLVCGLDGKIGTLEDKQDFANAGVWYLCQFIGSKDGKMPDFLQSVPKPKRSFLGYSGTKGLKGLQDIADVFQSGSIDSSNQDGITQNAIDVMDTPKSLSRTASIKC